MARSASARRDRSPLLCYGSEGDNASDDLPVHSCQFTDTDKRGILPRKIRLRTLFYALNGAALLVLLSLCVSMHSTISRLESQAVSSVGGVRESRHETTDAREGFGAGAIRYIVEDGLVPMALLPSKFAVDYVTPRQDQAHRGTCWDFATIGFLEQSYRAHGVHKGWLEPDEYVAFSEQAYGVEVLKLCSGDANSQQQKDCRVAGDKMWMNSTEGGEVPELYYLQNGLKESVFPQLVCKYYADPGNDTLCPGLAAAQAAGNPLKFALLSMTTKYEDMSVREHLVRRNQAMPLSTPIAMVTHYYPCIGALTSSRHCQPETCTLCPGDMATTTCCVPLKGRNRNMEGEFFSHRSMSIEGGHAMLLVGYNDALMTREGFTGGLIVKNSWRDGPYQGSHSLAYWMQEISDWEERSVCPNSYNPFNWYQCGNVGISSKEQQGNESKEYNKGIEDCLSKETKLFADVNIQPLHLQCKNPELCRTDEDITYFVRNTTDWGDRMTVMCLWEYSSGEHVAREVCLPPMLEVHIALTLAPVEEEVKENDTDRCGFYFIPYLALREWIARFQGFFVNSFDVQWDPQAYAANKHLHPELDYSLLEASTKRQNHSEFLGPFPYAKVIQRFQ